MARIIDLKNKKKPLDETPFSRAPIPPQQMTATPRPLHQPVQQAESSVQDNKTKAGPRTKQPEIAEDRHEETGSSDLQIFSWIGPLYHHDPNKRAVAVLSVGLFIIAALVGVFQRNVISTIFFALLGGMVLLRASKKPDLARFEINPLGIRVGEKFYKFRDIKSFWIEYDSRLNIKELSIQMKKRYTTYLKIPIEGQNPVQLRTILIKFIPEVEHEDTMADTISRRLGI